METCHRNQTKQVSFFLTSVEPSVKRIDLRTLTFSGTYQAETSTGSPSCISPREPTIYVE